MSDQSELELFIHAPHHAGYEQSLRCLLEHLSPAEFVRNGLLLQALHAFWQRATADQLSTLLPPRSHPDSAHPIQLAPLTLSRPAAWRLPQVTPDSPRRTVASVSMPDPSSVQRSSHATRDRSVSSASQSQSQSNQDAESTTRLSASDSLFVRNDPPADTARSSPAANGTPASLHSVSPSISHGRYDASEQARRSTQRLLKLLEALPHSDHHIPKEIKAKPQQLWSEERIILPQQNEEIDAIIRYRCLRNGEKHCAAEMQMLRSRSLMLKILQGNEHEIAQTRLMDQPHRSNFHVDEELSHIFNVSIQHVRRLRALQKKYLTVMAAFGPGAILVLSGGHTEWSRLSETQCQVFVAYVQQYRPDWVQLAQLLNYTAAVGLVTASRRVGMLWETFRDSRSPVASIVMQYIEVDGEDLRPRSCPRRAPTPPTASMVETVRELHQLVDHPVRAEDRQIVSPDPWGPEVALADTGSIAPLDWEGDQARWNGRSRPHSFEVDAQPVQWDRKRKGREDGSEEAQEERLPKQTRTQVSPEINEDGIMDLDDDRSKYLEQRNHVADLENEFWNSLQERG